MNADVSMLLAQGDQGAGAAGAVGVIFIIIYLAIIVVVLAGMWKVFVKAGQPGWGILIPIYNIVCLLNVAQRPLWWIILFFIPCVNIIPLVVIPFDVAKNFGKGPGFGVGLLLLGFIFYPILGFGDARYQPVPH